MSAVTDYKFKTVPFAHQEEVFLASRDAKSFALFMEMGTGKTKVILDTAGWLYGQGKIDTLIIICPSEVRRVWPDETEKHLPNYVPRLSLVWQASATSRKWFVDAAMDLIRFDKGLSILAMNVEATITVKGKAFLNRLLTGRRVMMVIDESTVIKTPGAKRTKSIKALGKKALYRRIMTGTPAPEAPLNLYSQFGFLDTTILGFGSYYAFKQIYTVWEKGYAGSTGNTYETLVEYVRVDQLMESIKPYSYRVLKVDCLDLPPKTYERRYCTLTKEVRAVYDKLRDDYEVEFNSDDRK